MALVLAFFFLFATTADELFQRGVLALKRNDNQAARAALEEAAKLAPREPMIWLAVAEARLRANEPAPAAAAVTQASRLAPADATVAKGREMFYGRLFAYARALLDNRQEKLAEAAFLAARSVNAKDPELHRLLGLALYAQGRNEPAIDAFLAAIDLAPDDEALYAGLETLLPNTARRAAIDARLKPFSVRSPLGSYLLGLSTGNAAYFEAALQHDPAFWPAAFALHKTVPAPRAIALLEQVITRNPNYAPAHYALSQLYAKQGDREKAQAARKRHHELTAQGK
ncbi:MAG: tetratricopeptide repeat protein [Bryobacterales bacterium]|nr:tetratricopeptide repeat protein [Bryobacterales bacterium]